MLHIRQGSCAGCELRCCSCAGLCSRSAQFDNGFIVPLCSCAGRRLKFAPRAQGGGSPHQHEPLWPDRRGSRTQFFGRESEHGPIAVIRRPCPRGTITQSQRLVLEAECACTASVRQRKAGWPREVWCRGRVAGFPTRVLLYGVHCAFRMGVQSQEPSLRLQS